MSPIGGMTHNGGRILVLAPHPDDEVVGFAAFIARRRRLGVPMAVLWLTEGVPAAEQLWPWHRRRRPAWVDRRRMEAMKAANLLGLKPVGLLPVASRTLKDHLAMARDAVAAAVARLAIDTLWVPAYEGGHQDHDATNCLAASFRGELAVYEAPLYHFAGGVVHSQAFVNGDEGDVIVLSPRERARKRRLLRLYRSESGNLSHIGVTREALRPQVSYDYSQPAHAGRTFYQRFQWVPFRHPRIDFTTPEQVCRVLEQFR